MKVKYAKKHPDCEHCKSAEKIMKINQDTLRKAVAKVEKLDAENEHLKFLLNIGGQHDLLNDYRRLTDELKAEIADLKAELQAIRPV